MLGMLIRNLLLCWTSFRFVAETFYALDISIYLSLSLSPHFFGMSATIHLISFRLVLRKEEKTFGSQRKKGAPKLIEENFSILSL